MLAQLLSSKPKTQLINLLLAHPARSFSFTELRASSGCSGSLLKETLKELEKMDFLNVLAKNKVKYYQINRHFALYPELVNFLRKVKSVPQDQLAKTASRLGECKLVVLTGVFAGKPRLETDILLVGKVKPSRLSKFLALAEKFAEQEVNYTILNTQEFEYRKSMNDRFVKNVMENSPVVVFDRTKKRKEHAWTR